MLRPLRGSKTRIISFKGIKVDKSDLVRINFSSFVSKMDTCIKMFSYCTDQKMKGTILILKFIIFPFKRYQLTFINFMLFFLVFFKLRCSRSCWQLFWRIRLIFSYTFMTNERAVLTLIIHPWNLLLHISALSKD